MDTFRATLTWPDGSTEALLVPLPEGAARPPRTLRRPAGVPGTFEVFELVDDEDWEQHRLAGYGFVGTGERG